MYIEGFMITLLNYPYQSYVFSAEWVTEFSRVYLVAEVGNLITFRHSTSISLSQHCQRQKIVKIVQNIWRVSEWLLSMQDYIQIFFLYKMGLILSCYKAFYNIYYNLINNNYTQFIFINTII